VASPVNPSTKTEVKDTVYTLVKSLRGDPAVIDPAHTLLASVDVQTPSGAFSPLDYYPDLLIGFACVKKLAHKFPAAAHQRPAIGWRKYTKRLLFAGGVDLLFGQTH